MNDDFDLVIVGGGLQGGLVALAVLDRHPTTRLLLVEAGSALGGNHTWSFHETDVPTRSRRWFDPLVGVRWPDYEVRFPNFTRTIPIGYGSIFSEQFHRVISERVARSSRAEILLESSVDSLTVDGVVFSSGRSLSARCVIDARGPTQVDRGSGYQKFVGLEVELDGPIAPKRPVIMDGTVPQVDGYRFLYLLPFAPNRCLVEDTYFSDSPALDPWGIQPRLDGAMEALGLRYRRVIREESGVLPMPWEGSVTLGPSPGPLVLGYRGGWFHPATGYSLPIAVRLAQAVGDHWGEATLRPALDQLLAIHASQARYGRLLNRLLFQAFDGDKRWNVFARFYRLPTSVISRFYSMEMTLADRAWLLIGRPPRGFSVRRFAERCRA